MANLKTLTDENRLDLNLDKYDVYEVMPGHYDQLYPNLANFLIAYYESLENEDNPAKLVNDLLTNRDVVSVRQEFLGFLSNELLLGKPYFEQFKDKRTALQFSNLLYRSKGTEYSIQQFFRIFYSINSFIEVIFHHDGCSEPVVKVENGYGEAAWLVYERFFVRLNPYLFFGILDHACRFPLASPGISSMWEKYYFSTDFKLLQFFIFRKFVITVKP